MMKKVFEITLTDNTTHEINLRDMMPDAPINVSAKDPRIIKAAKELAMEGFGKDGEHPVWHAPSQIKQVRIVFEQVEAETISLTQP